MEQNVYFRVGAGSVIYRPDGKIAIFERASHPVGVWQLQQGGVDAGETVEAGLWRELLEETGCTQEDFMTITPYEHWTIYEYPNELRLASDNPQPNRLGQAHRWWFLELRDNVEIDLAKAIDKEFSDLEWVSFDELIARTKDFKKHVYVELAEFFSKEIVK